MDEALINELAQKFAEHRANTAADFEISGLPPQVAHVIWVAQAKEVLTVLAPLITSELV